MFMLVQWTANQLGMERGGDSERETERKRERRALVSVVHAGSVDRKPTEDEGKEIVT